MHFGERSVHLRCIGQGTRFSFARSACFCSIVRCSSAPRCAAWASSSSTCCTAKGSAHPSLRPTERGRPRRMPPLDLWALLGPRVTAASMRSAHTAAFPDRIGMRSIFSCRTTRPSAARKASAPTSGARRTDLRIELHADCTVDVRQCTHQPPLNATAAAPRSSREASRPATRFSRTISPRARLIRAVQGWFRHSIWQVCVLAHS
jgi:hypothetical protein